MEQQPASRICGAGGPARRFAEEEAEEELTPPVRVDVGWRRSVIGVERFLAGIALSPCFTEPGALTGYGCARGEKKTTTLFQQRFARYSVSSMKALEGEAYRVKVALGPLARRRV